MRAGVRFFEIVGPIASKVAWAFAKWEPPPPRSFHPPARATIAGAPAWWRASFPAPAPGGEPLFLDLAGLTKGQVFLNAKNLSRYFVATDSGKSVAGQRRVRLPASWLNANANNDVLVSWTAGGGRTNVVVSDTTVAGSYTNVSPAMPIHVPTPSCFLSFSRW
jgi:hypothetical protein